MSTTSRMIQKEQTFVSNSIENKDNPIKSSLNVMLRQSLTSIFKKAVWDQISSVPASIFITKQKEILKNLLNHQQEFEQYFLRFYNNHNELYSWYILASEKHHQIKNYIFVELLKKTIKQYRLELKGNACKGQNITENKKVQVTKYCQRFTAESPKKIFIMKQSNNREKNISVNLLRKQKNQLQKQYGQQQNEDYHELFMNTLDACSGYKYIHYNFIKHQLGYEKRHKYNDFIRIQRIENKLKSDKNNQKQMSKTLSIPFRSFEVEDQNSFTENIASMYESFYWTPKTSEPGVRNAHKNKWDSVGVNSFQLTPIGRAKKLDKMKGNQQKQRKNLVIKKLPNRFGKQKLTEYNLTESLLLKNQKNLLR